MDNKKLVPQLLKVISKLNKIQKNDVDVQSGFLKKYRENFPEVIPPIVPSFVACCALVVDFKTKKLVLLFSSWPVAFIGDGCSIKKLAGEKLAEQVRLICLTTCCSNHAAVHLLNTQKPYVLMRWSPLHLDLGQF